MAPKTNYQISGNEKNQDKSLREQKLIEIAANQLADLLLAQVRHKRAGGNQKLSNTDKIRNIKGGEIL